jgi:pimeloyl-ACP methyl ester carboxylesterase
MIAYARRGHGQSDTPSGPYDEAMLVEDLRQLFDKLGLKRAILLGWSRL